MAGRFGASVDIQRPIEVVFDLLADGENGKRFSPQVAEIRKSNPRPPGPGATSILAAKVFVAGEALAARG
jgi:hypothetical protein